MCSTFNKGTFVAWIWVAVFCFMLIGRFLFDIEKKQNVRKEVPISKTIAKQMEGPLK